MTHCESLGICTAMTVHGTQQVAANHVQKKHVFTIHPGCMSCESSHSSRNLQDEVSFRCCAVKSIERTNMCPRFIFLDRNVSALGQLPSRAQAIYRGCS